MHEKIASSFFDEFRKIGARKFFVGSGGPEETYPVTVQPGGKKPSPSKPSTSADPKAFWKERIFKVKRREVPIKGIRAV